MIFKKYKNLSWPERILKFLASLELAVIIILMLAIVSAVGTVVEARYDAEFAQKTVYHSPFHYFILGLLCINLINVMIDRWPWKRHHIGFVCAHVGIITLLAGSLITRYYGVDGSLVIPEGKSSGLVSMPERELVIYNMNKGRVEQIYRRPLDLLMSHPKENPQAPFILENKELVISDYYHYAVPQSRIVASESEGEPALRVQMESSRFNVTEWLIKERGKPVSFIDFGQAKLSIADDNYLPADKRNEIVFYPESDGFRYRVFTKREGGSEKSGRAKAGDVVETGWMDMKLRFLNYYPKARNKYSFEYRKRPTPMTTSAMAFDYNGNQHWVALNSSVKLFTDRAAYIVYYGNLKFNLGFQILLKKFEVGRYQGISRAASYASTVGVPGLGEARIYMNNPLKYKGYTFYQASFIESDMGGPTSSILSVNKDPGRGIKNVGSFLIVLGSILLFYFKKVMARKAKKKGSA